MPNFLDIQDFTTPAWVGVSKVSEPIFNNTDRKIQELTQAPIIEPTAMSQEEFYSKVDNAIASWDFAWETEEQIYNWMLDSITSDWINIEWIEFTPPKVEPLIDEDKSWLDIWVEFWQGLSETAKEFKFESNVDDWVIESWLKFLGNVPWNTAQIAWDLISLFSDPLWIADSVKTLAKAWIESWLNKLFLEKGEEVFTSEEIEQVATVVWKEMSKIATEPWRIKELLVENPADVLFAMTGWLWIAKNAAKTKWFTNLANKLEKAEAFTNPINVLKAESKLITKPIKAVWELAWRWVVKTTGLNFDTVKTIVKDPDLFKAAETGKLTRQTVADDVVKAIDKKAASISDLWTEYGNIRKLKANITPDDVNILKANINETLSKKNIEVVNWKLDFSNSQIWQAGNRKAIQDAYNLIQQRTKFDEWKDWLNLRQSVDDTINYKSDASTRWEKIVRWIRAEIDAIAKDKLPWLKELDAKFAPERWEFDRIAKLIRNKDWSLKDNYISTIANITWKGKELKLERLEKIMPDLSNQVKALKALEDVELAKGTKVWTYMNAWSIWVWAVAWGLPWAVMAYIITHPTTLVNVLKAYNVWAKTIKTIVNKVKNWIKLSTNEAKIVWVAIKDQAIEKIWKGFDDLADKTWARSKFIDDKTVVKKD